MVISNNPDVENQITEQHTTTKADALTLIQNFVGDSIALIEGT